MQAGLLIYDPNASHRMLEWVLRAEGLHWRPKRANV